MSEYVGFVGVHVDMTLNKPVTILQSIGSKIVFPENPLHRGCFLIPTTRFRSDSDYWDADTHRPPAAIVYDLYANVILAAPDFRFNQLVDYDVLWTDSEYEKSLQEEANKKEFHAAVGHDSALKQTPTN